MKELHIYLLGKGDYRCTCMDELPFSDDDYDRHSMIIVWELKQVVKDNSIQGKFKWLAVRVFLTSEDIHLTRPKNSYHRFHVIALHTNNEDIVYLKCFPYIVTCYLHGRRLKAATKIRFIKPIEFCYPFLLQWWPTPISKL